MDSEFTENDDFFERVENNLKEGQLRLIFFLEEAPQELKSIVDFLNRQMERTEVLIVEAKQYKQENTKIVVPLLFGYTEQARLVKKSVTVSTASQKQWNEQTFFSALKNAAPNQIQNAQLLMKFGLTVTGRNIEWGSGKERGSFTARLVVGNKRFSMFSVYTTGEFSINFGWNYQKLDELDSGMSEKFREDVNDKLKLDFTTDKWKTGWTMIPLSKLNTETFSIFEELSKKFVEKIKALVPA